MSVSARREALASLSAMIRGSTQLAARSPSSCPTSTSTSATASSRPATTSALVRSSTETAILPESAFPTSVVGSPLMVVAGICRRMSPWLKRSLITVAMRCAEAFSSGKKRTVTASPMGSRSSISTTPVRASTFCCEEVMITELVCCSGSRRMGVARSSVTSAWSTPGAAHVQPAHLLDKRDGRG